MSEWTDSRWALDEMSVSQRGEALMIVRPSDGAPSLAARELVRTGDRVRLHFVVGLVDLWIWAIIAHRACRAGDFPRAVSYLAHVAADPRCEVYLGPEHICELMWTP